MGDTEAVLSYAFQSERNLEMALLVGSHFEIIKNRVIAEFGGLLEDELRRQLPGVVIICNDLRTDSTKAYAGLFFGKPAWIDKFEVALESDDRNKLTMTFGVGMHKGSGVEPPGDLAAKLNAEFGRGKSNTSWLWNQYFKEPYRHWGSISTLIAIQKGKHAEAFSEIIDRLVGLFRFVEKDLDKATST